MALPTSDSIVCVPLGLPQPRASLPLPDAAFTRDRGLAITNFAAGTLHSGAHPELVLFMNRVDNNANRISTETGLFAKARIKQPKPCPN
jgi:hypothetical protein